MKKRTMLAVGMAAAGLFGVLATLQQPPREQNGAASPRAAVRAAEVVASAAASRRVLIDPGPHGLWLAKNVDGSTHVPPVVVSDSSGATVQNLGNAPTRLLELMAWPGEPATSSCERCALTRTICSPVLAPGSTWHAMSASAVVSLSVRRAADVDAAWDQAATAAGLGANATVADVVCAQAAHWGDQTAIACPATAFIDAIVRGGVTDVLPGGLDAAAARGEPIGGVVDQPGAAHSAKGTALDRYEALGVEDIGWAGPPEDGAPAERFVYDLPGAWVQSPDGLRSALHLFNPTGSCATIELAAYRTSTGLRGAYTHTLTAGALESIRLDTVEAFNDVHGSATIRLTSDRPIAAALTVDGPNSGSNFSYTVPAIRMPAVALASPTLRRLMPLGYQEKVNFAADAQHGGRRHDDIVRIPFLDRTSDLAPDQTIPDHAQGWETNISAFNPYADPLELAFRLQAEGEPRREFAYPLVPRVQTVFQPGFGLGKPGGVGWGEMIAMPVPLPVSIAVHSWRVASDAPLLIEGWGARTWSFDEAEPQPRTIGLPDLGGPAVASPEDPAAPKLTLTSTMTDTFGGRIALQNPLTMTAHVAIDTYAPLCGYAGTIERQIDARQHVLINVRDLPGVRSGANAAVVRVLDGAVAAMVELRRPEWSTAAAAAVDIASAYLGTPIDAKDDGPRPEALTARLAVTPTALTVDRAALTPLRALVGHVPDDVRCARYTATVDVPWLTVDVPEGAIPNVLTLTVNPRRLPSGDATGVVTVASADTTITGSPQRITVTVTGEAVNHDVGQVYLPYGGR
ncbi:MAG: hypothetical protein ABI780_06335 [Ardenticatenales bacterium]